MAKLLGDEFDAFHKQYPESYYLMCGQARQLQAAKPIR